MSSQDSPMGMQQSFGYNSTQPTSQYTSPLYDPSIQSSIAQQQIQYLIQQMEQYHMGNQQLMVTIRNALELNKANNTQAAAALLYEIIQRSDRTKDDADNYTVFLAQIQTLGQTLMQQLTMQYSATQIGNGGGYEDPNPGPYMNYQDMNMNQGMGMQNGMNGGAYQATQSMGMGNGYPKPNPTQQQPQQTYFPPKSFTGKELSETMKFMK